jgi:hypothetical protein
MTETDWLRADEPTLMVRYLELKVRRQRRKLRLFACACCRRIWHVFTDERSQQAVEASERYADKLIERGELSTAHRNANAVIEDSESTPAEQAASFVAQGDFGVESILYLTQRSAFAGGSLHKNEQVAQAAIVRDIFGNPFRPATLAKSWLASKGRTAQALAQTIYDDRAFDRLPILADALEDAGCTDAAILEHCRGPGPHVRGCWVVDLLLGKS